MKNCMTNGIKATKKRGIIKMYCEQHNKDFEVVKLVKTFTDKKRKVIGCSTCYKNRQTRNTNLFVPEPLIDKEWLCRARASHERIIAKYCKKVAA